MLQSTGMLTIIFSILIVCRNKLRLDNGCNHEGGNTPEVVPPRPTAQSYQSTESIVAVCEHFHNFQLVHHAIKTMKDRWRDTRSARTSETALDGLTFIFLQQIHAVSTQQLVHSLLQHNSGCNNSGLLWIDMKICLLMKNYPQYAPSINDQFFGESAFIQIVLPISVINVSSIVPLKATGRQFPMLWGTIIIDYEPRTLWNGHQHKHTNRGHRQLS